MSDDILGDPATEFGQRIRRRLAEETVIWFTTVARDGTPQPNPVWFLLEESSVLVYNRADAARLNHIRQHPQVCLHFDGNGRGGDIVVITGRAEFAPSAPPPHENPDYVGKYRDAMIRVSGSLDGFSAAYPVPVRIAPTKTRGH